MVTGQFHAPAILSTGNEIPVANVQETGLAMEPVCMDWGEKVSFAGRL
jgi:hypothetical protein